MPTDTDPLQAPPLANEPQLARTLERVCRQHGATDATTERLITEVVASVRAASELERVAAALGNDTPAADDLAAVLGFARRALDAARRRDTLTGYASAAELAPEIRFAIAAVVAEIWDREVDDYQQQNDDERADHPYEYLATLHGWLGPYSHVH
ncbi:hypothetical protein OG225_43195 (plasmid) [Nocardia sp. NBC_01377]|uniref:hypothetical protein n=1 Tax=Nocardia sp. NBC_01377 TaxID=2903595 RepID=UPI002F916A58